MTDLAILAQPRLLPDWLLPPEKPENGRDLHSFWCTPDRLPTFVADSLTCLRLLELLGPLHWVDFPERNLQRNWGQLTIPFRALVAAELIKLNEGIVSFGKLKSFLIEHPGLVWLLGFPLQPAPNHPLGFNAPASLPTQRHFTKMLHLLPNAGLQYLLADTVRLILEALRLRQAPPITCVSLDTKHILAWVKENNPKAYVKERFNKLKQPAGDPDCRLGCKRRHNQTTPTRNPRSAATVKIGEYYWGYGSGVVVTSVPPWGEFVLAELTQPFDQADTSYFFPLMAQAEHHLGFRPLIGTFDAAFDAWYVYAYFFRENDPAGGFAAVPFSEKGGYKVTDRRFSPDGLPLCAAGLPMTVHFTFTDRTTCLIEHERAKYICPLLAARRRRVCPVHHRNWKRGGCTAMMPTSIGARLRYTLDRTSETYKNAYRQRTAVECINSQAVALGIERPHLRNGQAIANQNTLIYTLINLRFLHRILSSCPSAAPP